MGNKKYVTRKDEPVSILYERDDNGQLELTALGLTKREHFVSQAFYALMSRVTLGTKREVREKRKQDILDTSIEMADEMINKLNEGRENE